MPDAQSDDSNAARRQDRSVALAAIVVTGIVGVAGPLITWRATRDAQAQAAHEQLMREDRAELRAVLDRAAIALERANSEVFEADGERERSPAGGLKADAPVFRRVDDVGFSSQRLLIRLDGERTHAADHYVRAATAQLQAIQLFNRRPTPARRQAAARALERASRETDAFVDSAHKLAGTTLSD